MYYTSDVLPSSRYTHRQLERYFWDEVGRGEYISYGSWVRAMVEKGVLVEHKESYTFDNFAEHLTIIVQHERSSRFVDGVYTCFDDETMYKGRVPSGEADWEKKWTRNPDPEYGEDGRLYYAGDGEWELVIWTREELSDEEYYDGVKWEHEGVEYDVTGLRKLYEDCYLTSKSFRRWMCELESSGELKRITK